MSIVLGCTKAQKNYSYQHLHGIMLVNLNKIAFELNLSHAEYRVMGVLIGYWHKDLKKAFPTINLLVQSCKMSKSTLLSCLNNLNKKGLILTVKRTNKKNEYFFSQLLITNFGGTHGEPECCTACKTTHNKQINNLNKNHNKFIKPIKCLIKNDGLFLQHTTKINYQSNQIQPKFWELHQGYPEDAGDYFE